LSTPRIDTSEAFFIMPIAELYRINVRGIIKRIRKKFLYCDETFAEIDNFVGLGYRWANPTGAG
jgi:hypothetical protein